MDAEPPLELTRDAFLDGKVLIDQPMTGFRSGMDAVLLAAACPAQDRESVLEAGCGTGAALLCLARRVPSLSVTGIDIESEIASLARSNAALNGFADRVRIVCADVTAPWRQTVDCGSPRDAFHHVIANPPYYHEGETRKASSAQRARARAMEPGALDHWLRFLVSATRPDGTCTVIHRTAALPALLDAFQNRFGNLCVIPIHSKPGSGAIRVIVSGIKGSKAPLTLLPGLTLQETDGTPSAMASSILREGASIPIRERSQQTTSRKAC